MANTDTLNTVNVDGPYSEIVRSHFYQATASEKLNATDFVTVDEFDAKDFKITGICSNVSLIGTNVAVFLLDSNNVVVWKITNDNDGCVDFSKIDFPLMTKFSDDATGDLKIAIGSTVASNGTTSGNVSAGSFAHVIVCGEPINY